MTDSYQHIEEQISKLSDLESQEMALGNIEAAQDALEWRNTMTDMLAVVRAAKALTNAQKPPFEGVESTDEWWDFCYALDKLEK